MPDGIDTTVALWDDGAGILGPLTQTRHPAAVRSGALSGVERLELAGIRQILMIEAPGEPGADELVERLGARAAGALVVSARGIIGPESILEIEPGEVVVEPGSGGFVAGRVDAERLREIARSVRAGEPIDGAREAHGPCLLHRPWDVIRYRDAAIRQDLSLILGAEDRWLRQAPGHITILGEGRVAIDPSADVLPTVVIDATGGPVVIDRGATIRPGATLIGPVYVGPGSTVLDRALIKANTAIGPVCKVAGEIGGTIFQGFANKAHDGHLGDSWVGEWANLGAGTLNSNLLNTYGEVAARAEPGRPRERTGLTFLGAIIGDHVKTAIGTRLYTGSVIGTGAMIASTAPAPTDAPPFAWVTDAGVKTFRLEKFLEVARTAMARRKVELDPELESRLRALHGERPEGVAP